MKSKKSSNDAKNQQSQGLLVILEMARDKGFEPLTFWSVARRSIQLS